MIFKIIMYFSLDAVFYFLMVSSDTTLEFYLYYLLLGVSVLLTAFNISHDASHGVAVKSKFWNKMLFSLSFNLQGNNAYVWGKNHNESHHLYTNVEGINAFPFCFPSQPSSGSLLSKISCPHRLKIINLKFKKRKS